jgi:hypothetical protein
MKQKNKIKINVPENIYSVQRMLNSQMLSGLYVSNVDIHRVLKSVGISAIQGERDGLWENLFNEEKSIKKLPEILEELRNLALRRIAKYSAIKANYPNSAEMIDIWITKSNKSVERISEEIEKLA